MTTIEDVLTYADGSKANGRLAVFWRPFTIGNANVTGGELAYDIVDGAVSVTVYPNAGALPSGSYYSAKYELENGVVYIEQWIVPNLPTVNLGQVRVSFPPTPSVLISPTQLTSMNAQPGMFLMWDGVRWVPGYPSTFNLNPNWIGINIGGLGSDVNVVGSPVSVGNYATIHVPDAGPAARGVVTTAAQTIGGPKTFANTATISQSLLFTQHTVYTAIRGELVNIGSGAAHALNFGGDIVALRIAGTDRTRMQADRLVSGQLDLDTIADPPTATMPGSALSPVKGAETISLPHDGIDWAGIGMATDGSLWLRTAGAFLYLNANGVTCRELRMDPYQHPNAVGVEAARSDATMVVYSDSTSWGGYGVDNTPQLWFRMGPNSGAAYYYFGAGGATFPGLTVTHLTVSGSIVVPPGAGLIPTYWVDGVPAGTRPILNFISGANIGIDGVDLSINNRVDLTITSSGTSGAIVDPTDTKGDLIVRGAAPPAAVTKLGVGANGQVLTADNTVVTGIKWAVATLANDSSTQRLRISQGGVLKGTRQELNLIAGANVTLTVADNPGNNRVDATVTVASMVTPLSPWTSDIDAAGFTLKNAGKIGVGVVPTTLIHARGPNSPGILVENTANTVAIELKDSAATPNRWWLACGLATTTDGKFGIYDARQAVSRLSIDTAGNVGIGTGTAVPLAPLHVAVDVPRQLYLTSSSDPVNKQMRIGYDVTNNTCVVQAWFSSAGSGLLLNPAGGNVGVGAVSPALTHPLEVHVGTNMNFWFGPAAAVPNAAVLHAANDAGSVNIPMEIRASPVAFMVGNVGIGIASPSVLLSLGGTVASRKLAVYETASDFFGFGISASLLRYDSGAGSDHGFFTAGGTERMRITSGGYVGIGTAAPGTLVHMKGSGDTTLTIESTVGTPYISWKHGAQVWWEGVGINSDTNWSLYDQINTRFLIVATVGGNVGIGTTNPQSKFAVIAATNPTTPDTATQITVGETSNNSAYRMAMGFYVDTGGFWKGVLQATNGGPAAGTLLLQPSGGSVGIRTVSPVVPLDLVTGSMAYTVPNAGSGAFRISSDAWNTAPSLFMGVDTSINSSWIQAIQAGVVANPLLLNPNGGNVGVGRTAPPLPLTVYQSPAQEPSLTTNTGLMMLFCSTGVSLAAGVGSAANQVWIQGKISSNDGRAFPLSLNPLGGGVAVGRTAPGYALDVVGDVNCTGTFRVNGAAFSGGVGVQINGGAAAGPFPFLNFQAGLNMVITGVIGGSGNNTMTLNIGSSSDLRLKRNVRSLAGGLPIIRDLRPVSAEWNGLASTREGQRMVSIIAQELRTVIPDAVAPFRAKLRPEDSEETELLQFDSMAITAHLILAVQQLERRLKVLEGG